MNPGTQAPKEAEPGPTGQKLAKREAETTLSATGIQCESIYFKLDGVN
jgi:hypothetical protein